MNATTRAALCSSSSECWNSPSHILDSVYRVLGHVDLDPCSNMDWFWDIGLKTHNVRAELHFCERVNGLLQRWDGTVYLNPPYGDQLLPWITKLDYEYRAGHVTEAIVLIPGRLETEWFNILSPHYIRCEILTRLHFSNSKNSATFPSVLFYLGTRENRFIEEFKQYGNIVKCIAPSTYERKTRRKITGVNLTEERVNVQQMVLL